MHTVSKFILRIYIFSNLLKLTTTDSNRNHARTNLPVATALKNWFDTVMSHHVLAWNAYLWIGYKINSNLLFMWHLIYLYVCGERKSVESCAFIKSMIQQLNLQRNYRYICSNDLSVCLLHSIAKMVHHNETFVTHQIYQRNNNPYNLTNSRSMRYRVWRRKRAGISERVGTKQGSFGFACKGIIFRHTEVTTSLKNIRFEFQRIFHFQTTDIEISKRITCNIWVWQMTFSLRSYLLN